MPSRAAASRRSSWFETAAATFGLEPAHADLVEQVQERVVELGDHQDDLRLAARLGDPGVHVVGGEDRGEAQAHGIGPGKARRLKSHPHEEAVGFRVTILVGFKDVPAKRRDRRGNGGDTAGLVGAGEGEHVSRMGGGIGRGIGHGLLSRAFGLPLDGHPPPLGSPARKRTGRHGFDKTAFPIGYPAFRSAPDAACKRRATRFRNRVLRRFETPSPGPRPLAPPRAHG